MKKCIAVLKEGGDTSKFRAAVEKMGGVVRDVNVKYILVELPGEAGDLKKLRDIPEVKIADTVKYAKLAGS